MRLGALMVGAHPVWPILKEKSSLSKPPELTLIAHLREEQGRCLACSLLVDVQRPHSSSIHVVPQLHTGAFAWRCLNMETWLINLQDGEKKKKEKLSDCNCYLIVWFANYMCFSQNKALTTHPHIELIASK